MLEQLTSLDRIQLVGGVRAQHAGCVLQRVFVQLLQQDVIGSGPAPDHQRLIEREPG